MPTYVRAVEPDSTVRPETTAATRQNSDYTLCPACTAAVAGAVLIAMDLPHPSSLADEERRILFTFIGVGIAVVVMFLAGRLSKHTAKAAPRAA